MKFKGDLQEFVMRIVLAMDACLFLIIVYCFFLEVFYIISNQSASLDDILLLFIYLEVISMLLYYYEHQEIPIHMPVCISIIALARFIIIDMKQMTSTHILFISIAIAVLCLVVIAIQFFQPKKKSEMAKQIKKTTKK